MTDVFISYAHEDQPRIETLCQALEAEGVSVWWDRHIAGGAEFTSATEARLEGAKAVLVAWSAASVASTWVCDEATVGRDRNVLVPVTLDGTPPRLGFRSFQTIDLASWNGDRSAIPFQGLVRALKACIAGGPPAPVSIPERKPASRWHRRRVVIAGAVAAILAIVAGVAWLRLESPNVTTRPPVAVRGEGVGLAVLPFTNLSSDPEQEHFADGLTEEILNWLGNVEGLKVPGRTSSFQFKGRTEDMRAIGETLGVAYLLEGSVRRSGDALRITAQLIEAKTGFHLWSKTYDRTLDDLFAIQDELARLVVTELLGKIPDTGAANPAAVGDVDPKAHELYLEGRALFTHRRMPDAFEKFRAAIALDPRHAYAQAYAAVLAANARANGITLSGNLDMGAVATRALSEAVRLKPQTAEVLFAQGWVTEHTNADPFSAAAAAAAAPFYERTVRANPRHIEALHALGRGAMTAAETEPKAFELFKRVLEIDAAHVAARSNLIKLYMEHGDRPQAISLARQSLSAAPNASRRSAALAGRRLGDMALTGEAILQDWEATERDDVSRWFRASTLVDLGAVDEARFLFAREAVETKEPDWRYMAQINVAVLERNDDAGLRAAEAMLGLSPVPPWARWILADTLIRSGDPQKAYDLLVAGRPDLAGGKPRLVGPNAIADFPDPELLTAAHALSLLGRRSEARALWQAMRAEYDAEPPPMSWGGHIVLALLQANLGDAAAATKEFRAAYDAGFRHLRSYESFDSVQDGFYSDDGLFAALAAIPENAALIEKIKAENARTLEEFNKQYGVLDKVRAMMAARAG